MSKYKLLYITILFVYLVPFGGFSNVLAIESQMQTEIKADIPSVGTIRIYGYTAPYSLVQATGVRVYAQVPSDRDGYFIIDPLPLSAEATEVCLNTVDAERRLGFPFCFNVSAQDTHDIGPLLLSPTISLSKPIFWQNQSGAITGKTIPEAKVTIALYELGGPSLDPFHMFFSRLLHPEAEARGLPLLNTKSDRRGNYSLSVPTDKNTNFRLYAIAYYNEAPTLKSPTLIFSIGSWIEFFLRFILPKIIISLTVLIIITSTVVYEWRTKKLRRWFAVVNEKKLQPFEVRKRLQLRRIWYNFQDYLRSHRK